MVRRRNLAVITVCFLALLTLGLFFGGCSKGETGRASLEKATVERVVDGDTLKVSVGGKSYRVRLIGVDTPESVAYEESRNIPEGTEASDFTKALVFEGQTVYLQKDTSDTDQYDRLLRYVWLEDPGDQLRDTDVVGQRMLNGILVNEGYAQSKRYEPDTAYNDIFDKLQADAIANGRGVSYLWE